MNDPLGSKFVGVLVKFHTGNKIVKTAPYREEFFLQCTEPPLAHPHVNVGFFVPAHRSHDQSLWHNNDYVI